LSASSKKEKVASDAEQDAQQNDSVYDFLYQDTRRIGSFLAQFDDAGHLQQLKQTDTVKRSGRRGFKISAGGGVPLVASGNVGYELSPKDEGTVASERLYDPLWTNALTFLDYLEERDLVQRDLFQARIGQFVLLQGRITLFDLSLVKSMWHIPEARENAINSAVASRSTEPRKTVERDMNVLFQIAEYLPHEAQFLFSCKTGEVAWSLLRPEFLIGSAAELGLRYGMGIEGEWALLGIVDALPGDAEESEKTMATVVQAIPRHNVGVEVARVASMVRNMGRPQIAYGITPLLIFRSVSG